MARAMPAARSRQARRRRLAGHAVGLSAGDRRGAAGHGQHDRHREVRGRGAGFAVIAARQKVERTMTQLWAFTEVAVVCALSALVPAGFLLDATLSMRDVWQAGAEYTGNRAAH